MLSEDDLKEFYEMLEKNKAEYKKTPSPEVKDLLDEQFDLIQAFILNQTKIAAKLAGFKV
jgi:hypothetical protein